MERFDVVLLQTYPIDDRVLSLLIRLKGVLLVPKVIYQLALVSLSSVLSFRRPSVRGRGRFGNARDQEAMPRVSSHCCIGYSVTTCNDSGRRWTDE